MNCDEVRETLLDSVAERRLEMETHIGTCEECARFARVQRMLDARLTAAVPVASLSPGFRTSLRKKLRQEPASAWPESLPDIAHLAGCVLATALSLILLPQP